MSLSLITGGRTLAVASTLMIPSEGLREKFSTVLELRGGEFSASRASHLSDFSLRLCHHFLQTGSAERTTASNQSVQSRQHVPRVVHREYSDHTCMGTNLYLGKPGNP